MQEKVFFMLMTSWITSQQAPSLYRMMTSSNGNTFRVTGPLCVCVGGGGGGEIHQSPVNSPHTDQWCRALMFSLICDWIKGWVSNREAGDLKRHRAHYGVVVMDTPYDSLRPIFMSCIWFPVPQSKSHDILRQMLWYQSHDFEALTFIQKLTFGGD